jgi:hypothetical protein
MNSAFTTQKAYFMPLADGEMKHGNDIYRHGLGPMAHHGADGLGP